MTLDLKALHKLAFGALLAPAALFVACSSGDSVSLETAPEPGKPPESTGAGEDGICLLHNCNSDDECGSCSDGRTSCLVSEHRCVACDGATGTGCPDGQDCSSYGKCVPDGLTCPTDTHGVPTITCTASADCAACDPMHLICDTATKKCVACTAKDTSECQSTDTCVDGTCAGKCPTSCDADNACGQCGTTGHEAHACNAHKCAQCSPTYACPAGEKCSAQGTCSKLCGTTNNGVCQSDSDCAGCGGNATKCHKPINGGDGKCGPAASGCSDLGAGSAVLPEPWSKVTNLCSNDSDCSNVGVDINVGKMLRDLTGVDGINDANIEYGMNVCADITVGSGNTSLSCGVCVPCKYDSDCNDINIDQVALQAFGPIGSLAAALLLDQVFGPNAHKIQMYCESVAGDYGVCAPCPGFIYDCSVGTPEDTGYSGGSSGGGGSCNHDVCEVGGPMSGSCDACASDVCDVDSYCCTNTWDAQCVSEVGYYCSESCGGGTSSGGGTCSHDECVAGSALDSSCSTCASDLCAADSYCCNSQWDAQCVGEVDQYCSFSCGGGSTSGGSTSGGYGYCYHDECTEGGALDSSCSDCASAVCGSDSYCCDTAWDSTCVDAAYQICGC